jgi:uncharacterized protein
MEFDTYTLVLLLRGPRAHEYEGEELDRLQEAHLAHLRSLRERGVILAGGPFDDQEDETFRGMSLYAVPVEDARALAAADPAVRAGRLRVEVMTWYTPKGELHFAP